MIVLSDGTPCGHNYGGVSAIQLTKELAKERGLSVDERGFEKEFEKHKEISRAGVEKKFGGHGLILDTGELKAANKEVETRRVLVSA